MNKKGFTLVELLAVIAILAILVIIALPNVLKMYNDSKKNAFMTEAQTLAKEVSSKYISESMKGNKVSVISNKQNPLDMTGRELEYNFELDSQGKIKNMIVSNGTYCISTTKDYTKITKNDIRENCSYEELHNIAGTIKNRFYEESGRTDRSLVSSIVFYSDGRTINGAESYDVSEKKDGSIKMYVSQNSENTSLLDLTIVANGKIALPEDSSYLFAFNESNHCYSTSNISLIEFNHSIDTSNAKNMEGMFEQASGSAVYEGRKNFVRKDIKNLDLSGWNTDSVENMASMFRGISVENVNLDELNTSSVTEMYGMFEGSRITSLDLSNFDTKNVVEMGSMFGGIETTKIKGLNKFNTSKVTNMSCMFLGNKAENLDLSNFDTSNVTSMWGMFEGSRITNLDLSSFNTSKVTDMRKMFNGAIVAEIKGLNKFNTSKVTGMVWMFSDSTITTLDLSSFDTSKVMDMRWMFERCKATTGYAKDAQTAAKFNDSSVTNIPDTLKFTVK